MGEQRASRWRVGLGVLGLALILGFALTAETSHWNGTRWVVDSPAIIPVPAWAHLGRDAGLGPLKGPGEK